MSEGKPIMLKRCVGLLVRVALLAVIIWGSNLWLVRIRDSIQSHRSVLVGQPKLGEPSSPLVQQVVLVLIEGLRYDASLEMPFLNSLREQGFDAPCRAQYPSYFQNTWTTLISGAGPEINDAPLVDLPYEETSHLTVDDLFTEAHRANLTTALAGPQLWGRLVPAEVLGRTFLAPGTGGDSDQQVIEAALGFMEQIPPNFLLVQLSEAREAAQCCGIQSRAYQDAVLQADSQLREILETMSLRRSVLVVTSDHGYLTDGGYGGADEEVVLVPFVMAGGRAAPGSHEEIAQTDVAPTIAALLGLAVPSAAQGEIMFDALLMDEAESAEKWVSWSQQRVELADVYLESIGQEPLSQGARGDAEVAYSSFLVRNFGSAHSLAGFAVQGSDAEMAKGRSQRMATEQRRRLFVAVPAVLAVAYLLWRRWSQTTAVLVVSALGTVVIYNLLYIWEGEVYSFSGVGTWDASMSESVVRMARALLPGACILVWLTWRQRKRLPIGVATLNYSYALILAFFLALPLAVAYVGNGLEVTWRLPDPLLAFVQVSALIQLGVAAFMALLLPLVTIPLDRSLRWAAERVRAGRASNQ
jgi:hypothetical protein